MLGMTVALVLVVDNAWFGQGGRTEANGRPARMPLVDDTRITHPNQVFEKTERRSRPLGSK